MKSANEIRKELAESLDEAEWSWLKPHAERDAIILVARELDILEVGLSLALDERPAVEAWVNTRQIAKPTKDQLAEWDKHPESPFKCLIVQPFVLVQPVTLH